MARFREVEMWPGSGHVDLPWTDDPATDALVRSARRVCESYSRAIALEELDAPCSSLRVFPHLRTDGGEDLLLAVDTGRPDGGESAVVQVPALTGTLSGAERGRVVLDVLHASVLALAPHRGWPVEALERVRTHLLRDGVGFEWTSPWKSSPNRAMEARAVFRVVDDGFGRVSVELRHRRSGDLVARSEPAVTWNGPTGFRHVIRTLRWRGWTVELIPMVRSIGKEDFGDVLTVDPESAGIAPLPPLDEAISQQSPVSITLTPYDVPAGWVFLILDLGADGASMEELDSVEGMGTFTQLLEAELSKATSASSDISEWLDERPVEVTLIYENPDAWGEGTTRYGITVRRLADRLSVKAIRPADVLNAPDLSAAGLRAEIDRILADIVQILRSRATSRRRPPEARHPDAGIDR